LSGVAAAQSIKPVTRQSMDIMVTRYTVDANGERMGAPMQTIRYELSRVLTESGWKTTMTLGAPHGASSAEIARNPFFGGRVELDASGAFVLFDNEGRPVPVPAMMRALPVMSDDWSASIDGISITATSRADRLKEVEAKYGPPAGRILGRSQYLRRNGNQLEELLLDESTGVPMEINVAEDNELKGHVAFEYATVPGGRLRRKAMRSEFIVSEKGDRAITLSEFSSVRIVEEK
jgi:hypothetical protein